MKFHLFARAAGLSVVALLAVGCDRSGSTNNARFQDIDARPKTRDALIIEYKQMVSERCENGWTVPTMSPDECHARVRDKTAGCDAKSRVDMPEQVAVRQEAIDWAKKYSACVLLP